MSHVRVLAMKLPSKTVAELNFHALRLRVVERALDLYLEGRAPEAGAEGKMKPTRAGE